VGVPIFGGVEAGGTKFNLLIGVGGPFGEEEVLAERRIPTTTPDETLGRVLDFFREGEARFGPCAAFGIASFGPLDLDPDSSRWGSITRTPKAEWSGTDLARPLRDAFHRPIGIDSDVNGAALAEARWGAGRGCPTLVYLTVGTGIGGGLVHEGVRLRCLVHPEMGHLRTPRHPDDLAFPGVCSVHGDCLEGLASGPAVLARWGEPLERLPENHPAWGVLGFYLGQLCAGVTYLASPHRILLGGGVMEGGRLLPIVRRETRLLLGGYPTHPRLEGDLGDYLQLPAFGARAGGMGALALAEEALSAAPPGP
jgi:fructokinase